LGYTTIEFPNIFKVEQPKAVLPPIAVEPSPGTLAIRSPSPGTSMSPTLKTWSSKAATNGKEVIDVSSPKPKPVRFILQNAENYRVDDRLPSVPSSVHESLKKKREQHGNLCNDYYLKGKCPNEGFCNYVCASIRINKLRAR
jgi:hypothetical protein